MKPQPTQKKRAQLRDTLQLLTLTLILILTLHLSIQNYRIDGPSMEPTLHNQEYILVNKAAYLFNPPQRGDIIVFQYPLATQLIYVKRIIAIPGDIISVINQTIILNGATLREPYINKQDPFNPFDSFQNHLLGPNQYFVMGDNRGDSSDSRQWGYVPRQDIIGKATLIYWPLNEPNLGLIPN